MIVAIGLLTGITYSIFLLGLRAADLAVFVIDGVSGVQSQDIVLWRAAEELGIDLSRPERGTDEDDEGRSRRQVARGLLLSR